MSKECGKALARRLRDPNFLRFYFVGQGLDVGGGPDPLGAYQEFFPLITKIDCWDWEQGDAQFMSSIPDETLDFVHSSHCLEHMVDPVIALKNWFRLLKPGGHMVITIPDEDLYEQGIFPSTYNTDHKWTFTIFKTQSWSPRSCNLLSLLPQLGPSADILKVELLQHTFRYQLPRFDQTQTPSAESGIEFVVRKRPPMELHQKGRLPPPGHITPHGHYLLTGHTIEES
jgi:SAM-dependent methyltransferase